MKLIAFFALFFLPIVSFSQGVVNLTGIVLDEATRKPVAAKLQFFDANNKRVSEVPSSKSDGEYSAAGLKAGEYSVKILANGYFTESFPISIPKTDKYSEISHDFILKEKKLYQSFLLATSPFERNKSKLRIGFEDYLESFVTILKNNEEVTIEIQTYLDSKGNKPGLAKERSRNLVEYFISKGINQERITFSSTETVDTKNPPPTKSGAKGKRYVGSTYIVITKI